MTRIGRWLLYLLAGSALWGISSLAGGPLLPFVALVFGAGFELFTHRAAASGGRGSHDGRSGTL